MVGDPALHLAQRLAVRELSGQLGAELSLVARAAQEDDEVAGDLQGRVTAEVVFDQGQREVDAGGHPGRGGDVAVADEDRVRIHGQAGIPGSQCVAVGPVGGHPPPAEQAGLGQQERAGADRHQARGPGCAFPEPADEVRVGPAGSLSPGHDQHIRAHQLRAHQLRAH